MMELSHILSPLNWLHRSSNSAATKWKNSYFIGVGHPLRRDWAREPPIPGRFARELYARHPLAALSHHFAQWNFEEISP